MEGNLIEQNDLGDQISRLCINFNKANKEQKNRLNYVTNKIQELQALFEKFDQNHKDILSSHEDKSGHYFTSNYYGGIEEIYHKHYAKMVDHQCNLISKLREIDENNDAENMSKIYQLQKMYFETLRKNITNNYDNEADSTIELITADLAEQFTKISTTHERILNNVDNFDTIPNEINLAEFDKIKLEYFKFLAPINERLKKQTQSDNIRHVSKHEEIKFPKINVPKFSGDFLKWGTFKKIFEELVDSQPMSDLNKLIFLQQSLEPPASEVLGQIQPGSQNYKDCWARVVETFDNTRKLTTVMVERFLSQPQIRDETVDSLKLLYNTTKESIINLKSVNITFDTCEPLVVIMLLKKLDFRNRELFENFVKKPRENPTMDEFLSFLENRFQSLDSCFKKSAYSKPSYSKATHIVATSKKMSKCLFCQEASHHMFSCKKFSNLLLNKKWDFVKSKQICSLCLKDNHRVNDCSFRPCNINNCGRKHNSILHNPKNNIETNNNNGSKSSLCTQIQSEDYHFLFLGTVLVHVFGNKSKIIEARGILDNASQPNLISERLCKRLGLKPKIKFHQVSGIGAGQPINSSKYIEVEISSKHSSYSTNIEAIVLPSITNYLPKENLEMDKILNKHNLKVKLADPWFSKPECIDLLLNVQIYKDTRLNQEICLGPDIPTLYETKFGWVAMGQYTHHSQTTSSLTTTLLPHTDMYDNIPRLWEMDEPKDRNFISIEDKIAEEAFTSTVERNSNGRFVVQMPKCRNINELGESLSMAKTRFYSLERRFKRDHLFFLEYKKFLQEYLELGHMTKVDENEIPEINFILPHHAIIKEHSSTTKLRVVFDASAKTTTSLSLNDILYKGPKIQDGLFLNLVRFRFPQFVFSADIAKMYRQIFVSHDDQNLQIILWRNHTSEPFSFYKLTTITYGTKPAPYLATRCIQQIAKEVSETNPEIARIISSDFYVDDLISGCDDINIAISTQKKLIKILKDYGFHLRKWCSNHPALLQHIPTEDCEMEWDPQSKNDIIKTLGIIWNPKLDVFQVNKSQNCIQLDNTKPTKRSVSSDTGAIFDPLGLVNPTIVIAKLLLQELWQQKIDWDETLPDHIQLKWTSFKNDLHNLNTIKIPRLVLLAQSSTIQLHGFCDASEVAYGAVIYVRSIDSMGNIKTTILCSKSKVAPLHKRTLARLELCGATMLSELIQAVKVGLTYKINSIFLWTDSQIVVNWITRPSNTLKTFVANRVAEIQSNSDITEWNFIPGSINPADYISRGLTASQLLKCEAWFQGPAFLQEPEINWPNFRAHEPKTYNDSELEVKAVHTAVSCSEPDMIQTINHRNSMRTLKRVVAYILRFISNLKNKSKMTHKTKDLSVDELENAVEYIAKTLQKKHDLKSQISSSLKSLNVFVDKNGLLRVGGRLQNSMLSYNAKHPILLPRDEITLLLLTEIHIKNFHAGPQTLLAITRHHFWPIHGKRIASKVFHQCIRCAITKPRSIFQIMGNLPENRVTPLAPFSYTGVDFAGPFKIHHLGRGMRPTKIYLAVFVCFSVKAIHLDLVTDLTTKAFLACLKRFIARRGKPVKIYSDNATNFVGAKEELRKLQEFLQENQTDIINSLADNHIQWVTIPPRSPHFGGLWESFVRRAKFHFSDIIQMKKLTYEEFLTVVAEVEAVLNSRPLTPLSENPNDLKAITPFDFLIQGNISGLDEKSIEHSKNNLLGRWEVITQVRKEFWSRFSKEYLTNLQQRNKWTKRTDDIKPNTFVILKDSNLPPLKWELGRIDSVISGKDGHIRVVNVKTQNGIKKRAITEVAPLPLVHNESLVEHSLKTDSQETVQVEESQTPTKDKNVKINNIKNNHKNYSLINTFNIGNMLLNIIIFLLMICSILGSDVNFTKFDVHPGIYFDGVGEVNLVNHKWHLVTYYNMTEYWKTAYLLQQTPNKLKQLCNRPTCQEALNHLHVSLSDLNIMNHLIRKECHLLEFQKKKDAINSKVKRKRGAIDVIGNIAYDLFGTLDSRFAQNMEQKLLKVKQNEQHTLELIKNHTSILDQTAKIMKSNNDAIQNQFEKIQQQLDHFDEQDKINSNNILFNTIMSSTSLALAKYRETQLSIHQVAKDFRRGKLHPLLITPYELEKQLLIIARTLDSKYTLPSTHYEDIENILDVAIVHSENCLIFSIEIPLLSVELYSLYKLIPLPTVYDEKFMAIKPSSDYLAINSRRQEYYLLDNGEFAQCKNMDDYYLCEENHSTFKISENSHCEVQIYMKTKNSNRYCEFEVYHHDEIFLQLHTINKWIYSLNEEKQIKIICDESSYYKQLEGEGIMMLNPDCSIETRGTMIVGKKITLSTYIIKRIPAILPQMNLTAPIQTEIKQSIKKSAVIKLTDTSSITTSLQHIKNQQKLQDINDVTIFPQPNFHDFMSYGSILLLLIIIGSYFIIKKRKASVLRLVPNKSSKITNSSFNIPEELQI